MGSFTFSNSVSLRLGYGVHWSVTVPDSYMCVIVRFLYLTFYSHGSNSNVSHFSSTVWLVTLWFISVKNFLEMRNRTSGRVASFEILACCDSLNSKTCGYSSGGHNTQVNWLQLFSKSILKLILLFRLMRKLSPDIFQMKKRKTPSQGHSWVLYCHFSTMVVGEIRLGNRESCFLVPYCYTATLTASTDYTDAILPHCCAVLLPRLPNSNDDAGVHLVSTFFSYNLCHKYLEK